MGARAGVLGTGYRGVLRPVLFRYAGGDPEAVHDKMIATLARVGGNPALVRALKWLHGRPTNPITVAGVRFPGRVGLAAGMDKDAHAVLAWQGFGFAFAEIGTVTALAQPGNDKPRAFRLRRSEALINRMGFNNDGAKAMADRLHGLGVARGNRRAGIPLGISIGKTKAVPLELATQDYITSLRMLVPYADYIAVNVSSPNTPGLRALQAAAEIRTLLGALTREAARLGVGQPAGPVPIFVKVAPDLSWDELDAIIEAATEADVRGFIATNTTLARTGIDPADQALAAESGGLSGAPLTQRAAQVVAHLTANSTLPVMASGGITSVGAAKAMFDHGAKLIQLYTGFIYEGSGLIAAINAQAPTRRPA